MGQKEKISFIPAWPNKKDQMGHKHVGHRHVVDGSSMIGFSHVIYDSEEDISGIKSGPLAGKQHSNYWATRSNES